MARLFISHSSANNAEAVALRDWLKRDGWDDVFLDVDPDRGIAAEERWERALNEAASRCEAVLFLVSRAWLDSRWCLREFNLARRLNKRLFAAINACDEVVSVDTWLKTYSALAGIPTQFRLSDPDGNSLLMVAAP